MVTAFRIKPMSWKVGNVKLGNDTNNKKFYSKVVFTKSVRESFYEISLSDVARIRDFWIN